MFNQSEPNNLLGRRVYLSIGEPWDFSSLDGDGRLNGTIAGSYTPFDRATVLLLDTTMFEAKGVQVNQVICAGRYKRGLNLMEELAKNEPAGCNIYFNAFGKTISAADMPTLQLGFDEWGHWMIGSVHLI
jgi:hypothetical protein